MSDTPLLSDCRSTGSMLDLTLDGVSTHDGVTTLDEDEAKVRSKAETRSVVLLFANLYSAIFVPLQHLIMLSSLLTIGLTVLVTMYWSNHIEFCSATFLLIMGHCIYDWGTSPKGREASDIDVLAEHADKVLQELVALLNELFRFLTYPILTARAGMPAGVLSLT
ncbi:hypothetical protein ACHAW5_008149 [Stephanodiscus triporus]|uniref:Uncharacterized protein n=1 Tax=Stephanodiscus triporus TaxID=2934178 RepID=A0ABD3NCZ6_9STRA